MNDFEDLKERFPRISDKALISLVNGIDVSKELIRFRKKQNFFGRFLEKEAAKNPKKQALINGNLIEGQDALVQWVRELCEDQRISHVALQITQQKLLETQNSINGTIVEVEGLNQRLDDLANFVKGKLNNFDAYVEFEDIIRAWKARRTYKNLPWLVQIALLAQEVFSCCAIYKLSENEWKRYPQRLIDEIISYSNDLPNHSFALSKLLELSLAEMNGEDKSIVSWFLEIDSLENAHLFKIPHLFVIGKNFRLAILDNKVANPAQEAINICRNFAFLPSLTDKHKFVEAVVQETADVYLTIVKNEQADLGLPHAREDSDTLPNSPIVLPPQSPKTIPESSFSSLSQPENINSKIGLVLAGGGAKGAYQVGVLKYLSEELQFVPHMIAGTSIGALNGAFLASHQPFDEAVKRLDELWHEIGKKSILHPKLSFNLINGLSLFDPKPIEQLLRKYVKPDALRHGIKLWVTVYPSLKLRVPGLDYVGAMFDSLSKNNATKAEWLPIQEFHNDTIYNPILASAAIPLAFPPQKIDGKCRSYVDGFLGDNIPLGALAKQGCTVAIVIHLDNGETWSRHKFSNQGIIEIRPQLQINESLLSTLDFSAGHIAELKRRGEEDARRYLEPLILTLKANYQRRQALDSMMASTRRL